MNMIMLFPEDFVGVDLVEFSDERRLEHLNKIIRATPGKICKVGIFNGLKGRGEILEISREKVRMQIACQEEPPEKLPLTLVLALPRPQTLKKVIHGAVSMGAKKIYFTGGAKVEKSYWDSPKLEADALFYEQLLALEQSTDTRSIEIEFKKSLKIFVEDELTALAQNANFLIAHPDEKSTALQIDRRRETFLVLGPEGGFTDYELAMFECAKAQRISLGSRILRTEFALALLIGKLGNDYNQI